MSDSSLIKTEHRLIEQGKRHDSGGPRIVLHVV